MFNRLFGKPKQETNALSTLDKLNEVFFFIIGVLLSCYEFLLILVFLVVPAVF